MSSIRSAAGRMLADFGRDIAYAVRVLTRHRSFTAVAIATLAVTLGANTAMFSLVHRILLASLPVRQPEQLVLLSRSDLEQAGNTRFSYGFFRELESSSDLFEGVLGRAAGTERVTVGTDTGGEPALGELVSGSYFEVLGVRPHLGRLLAPSDDVTPGAHPVLVLSYHYWQRRFGGDAGVIGRMLRFTGTPMTVIGVTPPEFDGLDPGQSADLRFPMMMRAEVRSGPRDPSVTPRLPSRDNPGAAEMNIVGRLRPGITIEQAEQLLTDRYRRYLDEVVPSSEAGRTRRVSERLHLDSAAAGIGVTRTRYELSLRILMVITSIVLLIACLNLANLLWARASSRTHEFAVRLAVGAGVGRVVRQLLAEGMVLSAGGAAAGMLVAYPAARLLIQLITPIGSNQALTVNPNVTVLAFHAGTAVLAAALFGLVPALAAGRYGLSRVVRGSAAMASSGLTRRLFLALQVAFSVVVLVGAVLFVRTVSALQATDPGFRTDRLLTLALSPQNAGRSAAGTLPFFRAALDQVAALRGVSGVTYGQVRPLANVSWRSEVRIAGCCAEAPSAAFRNVVGPAYFATMGIPMVAGRDFNESDGASAPKVAVVNETLARTFGGGTSVLGARIGVSQPEYTIVGIASDSKYAHMRETAPPMWFVPHEQHPGVKYLDMYVRTAGDAASMSDSVRAAIASVDPEVAPFEVRTLETQVDNLLIVERTVAALAAMFGATAAGLAAIGVYGILAFVVATRRREIAIRMALGARPAAIVWRVTTETWVVLGVGAVAGIAAAAVLTRYAGSLLYGVTPLDAVSFASGVVLMTVATAAAVALPSLRATRVNPTDALREA